MHMQRKFFRISYKLQCKGMIYRSSVSAELFDHIESCNSNFSRKDSTIIHFQVNQKHKEIYNHWFYKHHSSKTYLFPSNPGSASHLSIAAGAMLRSPTTIILFPWLKINSHLFYKQQMRALVKYVTLQGHKEVMDETI